MAAEVISLGVWLDHIPLPVFSCCGWGLVVGQAEREREVEGEEGEVGEVEKDMVKDKWRGRWGVERWAVPTVLTKAAPVLRP